jgi:hypothetical protein
MGRGADKLGALVTFLWVGLGGIRGDSRRVVRLFAVPEMDPPTFHSGDVDDPLIGQSHELMFLPFVGVYNISVPATRLEAHQPIVKDKATRTAGLVIFFGTSGLVSGHQREGR